MASFPTLRGLTTYNRAGWDWLAQITNLNYDEVRSLVPRFVTAPLCCMLRLMLISWRRHSEIEASVFGDHSA